MKSIVKMSKYWIVGLLVGAATLMSARGDTNTTYTVSFTDYVVRGTTYSVPPIAGVHTGDALSKLNPSTLHGWLLGWADESETKYYDEKGEPLRTFTGEADLTLYAKLDPKYLPLGVSVNGQELDAMSEAGRQGEGWSYDFDNQLVTLSATGEYVLSGSNSDGRVYFQVTNNATVVLSNLVLKTTAGTRPGLIEMVPGAAVDIKLTGENLLEAGAADMAGIFCPTGASVKIWTERKRDVSMASPANMLSNGVLTEREYGNKDLSVQGGANAAAIGGRGVTDGGLSGKITVQNCSIWASGGSNAYDVGAGKLQLSSAGTNACGTVRFLGNPNVRNLVSAINSVPKVGPVLHGDWETPLFPRVVPSRGGPGETFFNVFWFPYGTTRVVSTGYSDSDGSVVTNEVSYTITHRDR